jgi:WD40 repeat protein
VNELPAGPYKGLAAFGDSPLDALLFFGREAEREGIVANLLASRLTILYGPSGVGKSSLLRAGVAQRLRALGDGVVIVHGEWAEADEAGLTAAVADADPELGPTAGVVDAVAAAAQRHGQAYLLLDQFEEYFAHHGEAGPLADVLPELLRRPGLRVNVLIALRDDALAELDAFAGSLPGLFGNLLRLDRLDRDAARAAVVGPLARYGELDGNVYGAEPALVDALLDEVAVGRVDLGSPAAAPGASDRVEAPFLQLVLERLWADEQAAGSNELRLETFERLGGAEPILREHVFGTLERLPAAEQDAAARVVRQLVTSSGAKTSYSAADLSDYASVEPAQLHALLEKLGGERIVRAVEGTAGDASRYEIFHDVLAPPLLAWRAGYELERERVSARRERRRLWTLVAAALVALAVVGAIAVFALAQRSSARSEARRAHARELAADALADVPTDPAASLALALQAAQLSPGAQTENVLRTSLLAMRELHVVDAGGPVVAARFAPAGNRVLVASASGKAGIYDAAGRELVALPRQHALTHAVWSDDGRLVATGGADGSVSVWRAADGRLVRRLPTSAPIAVLAFTRGSLLAGSGGYLRVVPLAGGRVRRLHVPGAVVAAALSPDGRLLAVTTKRGGRNTTRLLDARTGRVRRTLPERGIGSLAFDADGRLLVTGSADKTARVWDAATGRLLHVLPQAGHVLAETFSPDGKTLVTSSSDGTASLWDVKSGIRLLLLVGATGAAEDAAFSPDGKDVAVAFGDRLARVYETGDGKVASTLAGHTDAVTSVGYDAAGDAIVTGSDDGTVRLWSASPGNQLRVIDRRAGPVDARFAGAHVLSASGRELRVLTPLGRRVASIAMPAPIVAVAAHGGELAAADSAGDLKWMLPGSPAVAIGGAEVTAVAFAPDGSLLTGSRNGVVARWQTPIRVHTIHASGAVASISAGANAFAVRTAGGTVRVYALDGKLLRTLPARVRLAVLSPDGATVATAKAREADLWSVSTGKLVHRLLGHTGLVTDVEFSPDGSTLVTASVDHDGRLWDVATGGLLHVLRGHFFPVRTASFSPDGRWVVTASQYTAGLWDAASGQLVLYLQGNTEPLTGAGFSGDGTWIVTGGEDGTARTVRCDVCRDLPGLERLAEQRLRAVGRRER